MRIHQYFCKVLLSLILMTSFFIAEIAGSAPDCRDLFRPDPWRQITDELRSAPVPLDYQDNLSYLRAFKQAAGDGLMQSRYSEKFRTRFYFSATGLADKNGEVPMVDPKSRAIFLFFHGSGTMQASGRNFKGLMNSLGKIGHTGIGIDYPFHMDGPVESRFHSDKVFMKWLFDIVQDIRAQAPGKPLFLIGHSYGVPLIAEFVRRFPFAVDGASMMSPGAFDPVTIKWYRSQTKKMGFAVDVAINTVGDQWADRVAEKFLWNKTDGKDDPTVVNPRLRLRVLSGELEEYIPGPLDGRRRPIGARTYNVERAFRKHMQNAEVIVEPGVGHFIFDHIDANGRKVVLREILALVGEDPLHVERMTKEWAAIHKFEFEEQVLQKYATDKIFHAWVELALTRTRFLRAVHDADHGFLNKTMTSYTKARTQRETELRKWIFGLADRYPSLKQEFGLLMSRQASGEASADASIFLATFDAVEALHRQ